MRVCVCMSGDENTNIDMQLNSSYSFLDRVQGPSHTFDKTVKSVGLWLDKKDSRSYSNVVVAIECQINCMAWSSHWRETGRWMRPSSCSWRWCSSCSDSCALQLASSTSPHQRWWLRREREREDTYRDEHHWPGSLVVYSSLELSGSYTSCYNVYYGSTQLEFLVRRENFHTLCSTPLHAHIHVYTITFWMKFTHGQAHYSVSIWLHHRYFVV